MEEKLNLSFYYFDACPFCQLVLHLISDLNLKVKMKDIRKNQKHLETLVRDTNRQTVPCLYINGRAMFESRDIIAWIQENQDKIEKN